VAVIRVISANVGNGLAKPEQLISLIRESQADIVGLMELSLEQAEGLASLSDVYPFQDLYGLGIPGKGILARLPLLETRLMQWHPSRPDLQADAFVGEAQSIHIIVAHLPPQLTVRRVLQLNALIRTATNGKPTVMMGDFNMNMLYQGYRRLAAAGLIDAFAAAGVGAGRTYPRRRGQILLKPVVRIDFIWHTSHFRTLRSWVGTDFGSDHLPIIAELEWNNVSPNQ
jgi:endonuclease/exonuclease/phosphatase (EEP) superfamily protein YafD